MKEADMKFIKKVIALMALAASAFLIGCGEQTFTADQVNQKVTTAASEAAIKAADKARAEEAKLADSKWMQARNELRQMGATTAATGKFILVDNCNVKPDGFSQTQAMKNFPSSAFAEFRVGCTDKVYAMKAERDKIKRVAIAKGRAAEQQRTAKQKLAAANKARQGQKQRQG
jgi:hypothetical protein